MRPEPEFTPDASTGLLEAVTYNSERTGLGYEFLDEIEKAVLRIRENPHQYPIVDTPIRRVLIRRFPYGVFYVTGERRETVTAVVDLRQHPELKRLVRRGSTGAAQLAP